MENVVLTLQDRFEQQEITLIILSYQNCEFTLHFIQPVFLLFPHWFELNGTIRKSKPESRALAGFRFHTNLTTQILYNTLANRESQSCALRERIKLYKKTGYEATQLIREMSPTVPIMAVTAYVYAEDEERILNSGFDAYTSKPINAQKLQSDIVDLLKKQLIFM